MRAKTLLVTALCLFLSPFALADVSLAKSNSKTINTEFEAELEPCCGEPEPDAKGEAKHKTQTKNGAVKKDEFEGKVKVPVDPSSALGITDEAKAEAADIRLILSNSGEDYAECLLVLVEIETEDEDEEEETEAVYKVDVRLRNKKGSLVLEKKKGTCLILETGLEGVPNAQAEDVATATLVVNPNDRTQDIDFLQGTFTSK